MIIYTLGLRYQGIGLTHTHTSKCDGVTFWFQYLNKPVCMFQLNLSLIDLSMNTGILEYWNQNVTPSHFEVCVCVRPMP